MYFAKRGSYRLRFVYYEVRIFLLSVQIDPFKTVDIRYVPLILRSLTFAVIANDIGISLGISES